MMCEKFYDLPEALKTVPSQKFIAGYDFSIPF